MRTCYNCGSDKTYRNQWYKYTDGFICRYCRLKLIDSPKWNTITTHNRINPKGKGNIYLGFNPRKGICSKCGFKGRTDIHHLQYHNDLLKDTMELCRSCHMRESRTLHPTPRDPKTGRFLKATTST